MELPHIRHVPGFDDKCAQRVHLRRRNRNAFRALRARFSCFERSCLATYSQRGFNPRAVVHVTTEGEGIEPPRAFASPVFETGAVANRRLVPPRRSGWGTIPQGPKARPASNRVPSPTIGLPLRERVRPALGGLG